MRLFAGSPWARSSVPGKLAGQTCSDAWLGLFCCVESTMTHAFFMHQLLFHKPCSPPWACGRGQLVSASLQRALPATPGSVAAVLLTD